ncbi:uncharacterized protein LOC126253760 [Schistocerca nitens]|uniref:uncharacterized protein LOC126253760 n=1 Tax=Schistocerca nitens TaxID=7011 RepID=UPI002118CCAC|nr:uncharacterized protein LOC126253760 [Schistocerca nitens]XP_049811209.1 uncharacterized protein LOC126253760 [Schistocerca nitens]XP_049811210.1 uncharacterized protein LOC126253760 [Schistocerca nitens]
MKKRKSSNNKSKPKKKCSTFKRATSRKASAVKRKTKNSSATKPHSQQKINRITVAGDGCKNRKRKHNNEKEREKSKRSRLPSHNASHHNSRCNLCSQPEPKATRGKSSTKKNGSNHYRGVIELPCKKSVFEKACNLRRTIESGDLLPASLQPLLKDSVANKYDINELVATVKESKSKWQETEKRMLELDRCIRAELCINKANPEKCLPLLDELNCLEIDALMLKQNPRIVHTVQKLCQFVGNRGLGNFTEEEKTKYLDSAAQIRNKSKALFQKCQKLFGIEGGQSFKEVFKEKVQEYQETKNSKFLRELCQRVNKGFKKNQSSRPLRKRVSGNTK